MQQVNAYIPVTEAKNRLLDLVRGMARRDDVVAITRDGVPAAILLSVNRFQELMETIEVLSDSKAMTSLRKVSARPPGEMAGRGSRVWSERTVARCLIARVSRRRRRRPGLGRLHPQIKREIGVRSAR